jgi:hypothetical protein
VAATTDAQDQFSFFAPCRAEVALHASRLAEAAADATWGSEVEAALMDVSEEAQRIVERHNVDGTVVDFEVAVGGLRVRCDQGSAAFVADVLQASLTRYPGTPAIAFEFSVGDPLGGDEPHGGGAVIVTAEGQHWLRTAEWLTEARERYGVPGRP